MKSNLYSDCQPRDCLPRGELINGYCIGDVVKTDSTTIVYSTSAVDGGSLAQQSYYLRELFPVDVCTRSIDASNCSSLIEVVGEQRRLFDKCVERFVAEGKALAALDRSVGMVDVVEVFEANGSAYQVTEKPLGQSLEDRIRGIKQGTQSRLSTRELSQILAALLSALNEVHQRNILHRNINPRCIYLDAKNDTAQLTDFFAGGQVIRDSGALRSFATDGSLSSDASYTPAELIVARGNQGCWSDLYGLGASLYEAIALVPPVPATHRFEKLQGGEADTYIPLRVLLESAYPTRLLEAIDWMLRSNVRNRPKSVCELSDFLGLETTNSQQSRAWQLPRIRRVWEKRARPAKRAEVSASAVDTAQADQSTTLAPQSTEPWQVVETPLTRGKSHAMSALAALGLSSVVALCAAIYVHYSDLTEPASDNRVTAVEATTSTANSATAEHVQDNATAEAQTTAQNSTTQVADDNSQELLAAASASIKPVAGEVNADRAPRRFVVKNRRRVPPPGPRLDRYVKRHMNKAEMAWRKGHLLIPGPGSVLRHLEIIIDADSGNAQANAGINHLLYYFMDELRKAESTGNAVEIRYLNRNIRRVRLRHPASVPKSTPRFAALPKPASGSTRMADVTATNVPPDFTD